MLQGQKFQQGNYKLQNLMDAQMKYRISANKASGKPLEAITTPYDDQISNLEEDLNDSEIEYNLAKSNPITQSYKNKVRSMAGLGEPEQKLDEDVSQTPDLEASLDQEINPQPQPEQTQQLVGNDIQPNDAVYGDPNITKYDSDGYPLVTEDVVKNPGHSVLAQADAALIKKQKAGEPVPGAIGQQEAGPEGIAPGEPEAGIAPQGQGNVLQQIDKKLFEEIYPKMNKGFTDANQQYTGSIEETPYYPPPEDKEADVMMKNLDLLKTPPLKFKPEIYKKPKAEEFHYEPVQGTNQVGTYAKYIMDWSNFLGGKGWTNEAEKFYDKDMARLENYKADQYTKQQNLLEKNRQSDKDAFEKFQYDQNTKFKMASLDQAAQAKANALKLQMLKLQAQKGKKGADFKQAYKIGHDFQKLSHVEMYGGRVDAFKNAMNAPTTGSGDKDIIENLVKFIDPKGVIREGKVKFMQSALKTFSANPDGTVNQDKFNRMWHVAFKGGFLTPEDRKELLEATIPMMQNFTQSYKRTYDQYKTIMESQGYDPRLLMPFELAVATPEQLEAAKNKIYADYIKQVEDRKHYKGAIKTEVKTLPGQIMEGVQSFFGGEPKPTEPGAPVEPSGGDLNYDEIKKRYGI